MSAKAFVVTTIPDEYNAMQYLPEENEDEIFRFLQGIGYTERRKGNGLFLNAQRINPNDYVVKNVHSSSAQICSPTEFYDTYMIE